MKNNWPTKKIGQVCEVVGGGTPSTSVSEYWDGDIVWITPKDLGKLDKLEISDSIKKITQAGLENSSAKLLPKGSVVLSSRAPIGYVAITDTPLATNQGCRSFICDESKIYNRYLFHFLTTQVEYLNSLGGGSTFKEVSGSKLKEVEIPLPPLADQKKIVVKLEKLLAKVNEAKKLRTEAQEAISQLLPAELHKIFEEGKKKGWEEKELEGIAKSVADGTHDTPRYQDDGFPLVTSKNLRPEGLTFDTAKFISESDYKEINKRSRVSNGDILIGMIGTIGNVTRVNTDKKFSIKNVGLIRPDEKQVLGQYITYYLDNSRLKSLVVTGGTTQKFMALGTLRKIKVIYPPLSEQKKIVARLDSISEKTRKLQKYQKSTSDELGALEQSILSKAFSGEFV